MMTRMRQIATNSTLPALAYSPDFIHYEHYVSILKNTLLSVGVAVIGMIFIALMFIPHPVSITCVTITMVTIVLGMFGFMYFWDLELSAITNVQIILSVGFCVDFTVHISHAFMTATGKNRNERVVAAMEKVGIPILNGAFSSVLGVLILAFAHSYVFRSFFKTMLLVISLGLAHSLLLLPVMLSFIGPRRTSKPRVFIPIAANWASYGFGLRRHNRDAPGDDQQEDDDVTAAKTDPDGIELMTMDSPEECKHLLEPVPERADDPSTSTQLNRTLLDKTPEEEHYTDTIPFTDPQVNADTIHVTDIQIKVDPDLTPGSRLSSVSPKSHTSSSSQERAEDHSDKRQNKVSSRDQVKHRSKSRSCSEESSDRDDSLHISNTDVAIEESTHNEHNITTKDDSNMKESKI